MSESGYYPAGTEHDPNAPWNQTEQAPVKVEVLVSVVLSKPVEVEVSDYHAETVVDEDGNSSLNYDFSQCDLRAAVQEQIALPNEAFNRLHNVVYLSEDKKAIKAVDDLKDWDVDDYEVMLD